MSQLDDIMTEDGIPALLDVFGDTVTVTPAKRGAVSFEVVAMLTESFRYIGDVADLPETALLLECAKADWPEPQKGDKVVFKSKTYRVDRLEPTKTDTYFVAAWLVPNG